MAGPPILIASTTSDYTPVASLGDLGTTYRPLPGAGFQRIGHYTQAGIQPPNAPTAVLKVENDDPANPLLRPPVAYRFAGITGFVLIKVIIGVNPTLRIQISPIYVPTPPDGYVALGMAAGTLQPLDLTLAQFGNLAAVVEKQPLPFALDEVSCLRFDFATPGRFELAWSSKGRGDADKGENNYRILLTNTVFTTIGEPPEGKTYIPKILAGG